jgi:hypothetical protein
MSQQDLINALAGLTAGIAADRTAAQTAHNNLLQQLAAQQAANAQLIAQLQAAPAVGNVPAAQPVAPRVTSVAVESVPFFEGGKKDFAQDFVDIVERVGAAEGWTDGQHVQVASRRLAKTAMEWHNHTGHVHVTWGEWSDAFVAAFSPRVSYNEWYVMVSERKQRVGESGIEYALAKFKLLRLAPVPLNDGQMVNFLIDGLASHHHVSAMMTNTPVDFQAFLLRVRELEAISISPRHEALPASLNPHAPSRQASPAVHAAPVSDVGAALASFSSRLNELSSQLGRLTLGGGRGGGDARGGGAYRGGYDGDRGSGRGRGFVPLESRQCFQCGAMGHISRFCPSKSEKGSSGH